MTKFRYAAGLWALGGAADRFLPSGYAERAATLKEAVKIAGSVDGLDGVEIMSHQTDGLNLGEFQRWLTDNNLQLTSILANTFGDRKFKLGSITHTDKKIRQEAMDVCRRTIDNARELNCESINLWLGSDGHDYSFQIDYIRHWNMLEESVIEIANYGKDQKICLEYKLKEPRKFMSIGAVGKALNLARACGKNVGVVIDFGHALMAKEKPAESVVLLKKNDKLFGVHINDAYGDWDDDLIASSVHFQETLEFMYYLELMGFDGWIGLDIFPFRMEGKTAAELCIKNLRGIERVLSRIDKERLKQAMETLDAGNSQRILTEAFFPA
jgi:xylose isomerase